MGEATLVVGIFIIVVLIAIGFQIHKLELLIGYGIEIVIDTIEIGGTDGQNATMERVERQVKKD